ncbi:hypothetical protein EHI8A_142010 [Entamoeba histolytica HM-1:IMSS-B]|uniref:Uncharacterized protein n=3 Tax=Entamoeba histolytica TaxID=5759 RepID=M3TX11_ENTH1|nr:hypothetical protein EHI8A_142010 [Entamoeba histolytica HM-1:IMSS-B]EMS13358.1 hypothetical protein KM1_059240 [Entamoeba histolytica HM-3:IMSS]ENY60264.1 unknown protein, putative [Entamoeba histolytica HM-1:IMSS-A]
MFKFQPYKYIIQEFVSESINAEILNLYSEKLRNIFKQNYSEKPMTYDITLEDVLSSLNDYFKEDIACNTSLVLKIKQQTMMICNEILPKHIKMWGGK